VNDISALNQLCASASKASGKALVDILQQALNHPNIFVFGELLDVPSVQNLQNTDKGQLELLKIFAYGTLTDYKEGRSLELPPLSEVQLMKLKKLTLVSCSAERKVIPYSDLLQELDLKNLRDLEDLVIDSLYQGLIKGKLDQKCKHLEVDYAFGRDLRPGQLEEMTAILADWCVKSRDMINTLQQKVMTASTLEAANKLHKTELEHRIDTIKANLKVIDAEMIDTQGAMMGHPVFDDDDRMGMKMKGRARKGPSQGRKRNFFDK